MPHHLKDLIAVLPFMLATGEKTPAFSATRIMEALIIASVTAFGAGYVTQAVMQNELKHLDNSVIENHKDIRSMGLKLDRHIMAEFKRK